jgi:hypothetical protein
MTHWTMMLFVLTLLCGNNISQAQERQDTEETEDEELTLEEQMAKFVKLGPGVWGVQKDKKGHITSCIVVGQGRISTVLGKAKGMELAKNKANLDCSAQFVKWLGEDVTISESGDDESIILMEGEEGDDDESLKESSKSVEKSSKKMQVLSKGLVRGLQVLHNDTDGDGKTYTVIKGWKSDTAEGVKKVASDLASDEPESKEPNKKKPTVEAGGKKKRIDKDIESGSATSDDAAEFFPKKKE